MTTDELITLLTYDAAPALSFRARFLLAASAGILIAGVLFFAVIGVRPDFDRASETVRFLLKFAITVPLAVGAIGLVMRAACPGMSHGFFRWLLVASAMLLFGAVIAELWLLPSQAWIANMIGHNARFCLTLIPLLSIAPFTCLFTALRHGAPARPGLAGAIAGLAAASIAAAFYAANCDDDSPLFVLLWYPQAMGLVAAAGYWCGRRFLRW